jgi:hypothetical protein
MGTGAEPLEMQLCRREHAAMPLTQLGGTVLGHVGMLGHLGMPCPICHPDLQPYKGRNPMLTYTGDRLWPAHLPLQGLRDDIFYTTATHETYMWRGGRWALLYLVGGERWWL